MTVRREEWERLAEWVPAVDPGPVRVHRESGRGWSGLIRRAVLAVSGGRAVTLGNHVFLPEAAADDLATLAHELTHCGQYQRWGPVRYYSRGAWEQGRDLLHRLTGLGSSPYRYTVEPGRPFERYGMEQQGQMVEDRVRGITPLQPGPCPPTAPAHSRPDRQSSP